MVTENNLIPSDPSPFVFVIILLMVTENNLVTPPCVGYILLMVAKVYGGLPSGLLIIMILCKKHQSIS